MLWFVAIMKTMDTTRSHSDDAACSPRAGSAEIAIDPELSFLFSQERR